MLRRRIGRDGPEISQLTFGTMRLAERIDKMSAADFLSRLYDDGVDTHHSSFEYDSHAIYLDALAAAQRSGRSFQHIVKLSSPGFDSNRFDSRELTAHVDRELQQLDTEQLACVQWLVRTGDASNESAHVDILREQAANIEDSLAALVASGKVGAFTFFPYSVHAGAAAASLTCLSGLCAYLNLIETDFVPFLDDTNMLALRPLAAGRLARDPDEAGLDPATAAAPYTVELALKFPLLHPRVATIITSLRSSAQADSSIRAVCATEPDLNEFDRIPRAAEATQE